MRASLALLCLFSVISSACDPGETVIVAGGDAGSAVRICSSGSTQACLCAGRAAGAQICNASGTSWLACDCGGGPADVVLSDGTDAAADGAGDIPSELGPLPDVAPGKLNLSIEDPDGNAVSKLSAVHSIGVSPCPQRLGTVVALNETAFPAGLALSLGKAASIAFKPSASANVAVGATVRLDVEFTCASTASINSSISVSFGNATGDADSTISLALEVSDPGSAGCKSPADRSAISAGPDPAALAASKAQTCFLSGKSEDAEFTKCVEAALGTETTLSGECVTCYALAALCAKNNCLAECLGTPEACGACREKAGCNAGFYDCSGLPLGI
ncbi:MAG: hypothetical protein R3F39_07330 [Myxococcota bacterium]